VSIQHSAIQSHGFRYLVEGERVELDIAETSKGLEARSVVVVQIRRPYERGLWAYAPIALCNQTKGHK